MARFLLIKETNVSIGRAKGDIVDYFNDDKFFPPNIFTDFDVMEVPPFTKKEVSLILQEKYPEVSKIFKSETTEWTFSEPDSKKVWKTIQDEWCIYEEKPKHLFTLRDMGESDRAILEDAKVDKKTKAALFRGIVKETISLDPANLTKMTDLTAK